MQTTIEFTDSHQDYEVTFDYQPAEYEGGHLFAPECMEFETLLIDGKDQSELLEDADYCRWLEEKCDEVRKDEADADDYGDELYSAMREDW